MSRVIHLLFRGRWSDNLANAGLIDKAVVTIYKRADRIFACAIMQFMSWSLGSVEIWMALNFLGYPLPPLECVMIEALIQASASAAFAIPGALGVQEAGFLIFGGLLGLPHETAAALAVIRRCRDILFYAPGLVAWQMYEGKRLLKLPSQTSGL
jgi:uncharacterized membrane protein YbhN (UPF0104 family)